MLHNQLKKILGALASGKSGAGDHVFQVVSDLTHSLRKPNSSGFENGPMVGIAL